MEAEQKLDWYAIKVFYNRVAALTEYLKGRDVEIYTQKIVPSLVFVKAEEQLILDLRFERYQDLFVYSDRQTRKPCVIPEDQMRVFRLVTSSGDEGLEYLGEDEPKYHEGDLVRVLAGPLKGAEGHIKRIKKDRRLVVSIAGVCAVATSYIPPALLEKI